MRFDLTGFARTICLLVGAVLALAFAREIVQWKWGYEFAAAVIMCALFFILWNFFSKEKDDHP